MPFFPPLPLAGKQRSGAGSPAVALAGGQEEGKKEEGSERRRSPAVARPEMDRGGLATAAGDGDRGGATVELGGGPELGKKG